MKRKRIYKILSQTGVFFPKRKNNIKDSFPNWSFVYQKKEIIKDSFSNSSFVLLERRKMKKRVSQTGVLFY